MLNTAEAAEMLGVSSQTMRTLIEEGEVPAFVFGNRPGRRKIYRFDKVDLENYLKRSRAAAWDDPEALRRAGKGVLQAFHRTEDATSRQRQPARMQNRPRD